MIVDEPKAADREPAAVSALLAELARAGIRLRVAGADLEVGAPPGALTADLRSRIGQHKPGLIAWLRNRADRPAEVALPVVTPDPENLYRPFPPSDLQMSFLVGSRAGLQYHVRPHQYMELDFDNFDPVRFQRSFNRALARQRHNVVVVRDDVLLQTVDDVTPLTMPTHDLRELPADEAQRRIEEIRAGMLADELPLDRWPWLDIQISRYGDDRARLHYHNNNFFQDGPGTGALLGSALHLYGEPDAALPELELSYRDSVLALARLEDTPLGQASKRYWCDRMADWPEAPELPLRADGDRAGPAKLDRRDFTLPADVWSSFKKRSADFGVTPTNALYAAYAELVSYWSGSRHFLLNNMVTHRLPLHPQIGSIMGNFASLYPLEVDWRHDESFADRARRLQTRVIDDMAHVYWSGVKVLQTLNQVRRTPGRAACPFVIASGLFLGQTAKPVFGMLETPQVLLDCGLWEVGDGQLWVVWDLFEAMFPDGLVGDMQAGFRELLTRLATDDDAWHRRAFDLLPADQRRQREELNSAREPLPDGRLHDRLRPFAALQGERPAVVTTDHVLSYADLDATSRRVAAQLRGCGVRPGDRVAIVSAKGWQQSVAVFAALTADAVYVPIDPGWPAERIRHLLTDTAATAVLTTASLMASVTALTGVPAVAVDAAGDAPPAGDAPGTGVRPGDPAYIIYTSGSTGRPKGAMLDHRGPLNTIADINRRFGITSEDVLFGVSSLCFDLSVYDVLGSVHAGATLVLPDGTHADPAGWIEALRRHEVTVWNSVPALMQLVVTEAENAGLDLPALRVVLLSGDWIPVDLPPRIAKIAPNARVVSLGGATEASIWSITYPVDRYDPAWVSVPYGRPLANQTWHVLDDQGRDAPTWVTGHLHIGGAGVALGYLGDPDRTRDAFVSHPRTGERLYRTGDLGRYLPSGDIEFLGRSDDQVKIQGFRVEPGEIEHALLGHPSVRAAAVVARAAGSGRQLAAFVVPAEDETPPGQAELSEFLAGRLPGYLVPSYVEVLGALPLTGNGKLDRRALQSRELSQHRADRAAGRALTPAERTLITMWREILSVDAVDVHDDFFDLGGQSFAALQLVGLIRRRMGREVPVGVLLERRSVAGLAAWLADADDSWSPLVCLRDDTGEPPLFLVHPAGGNVLCYRPLAVLLDRPVYALQAPGPATGHELPQSVAGFAATYVAALRERQPVGPYRLGGWSSGALIAFEMARQLEDAGEHVAQVTLIDAPAPTAPRDIDDTLALLWFVEDLDIGFDPRRVSVARAAELAALPEPERLPRVLAMAREQGARVPEAAMTDIENTYAVFQAIVRACNAYRPSPVRAGLTVLRAADGVVGEFADHPMAAAPDWGWAALTTGTTTSATVPGTHHTVLTHPHVTVTADLMTGGPARQEDR